jgi:histidinol-phosphate aminotransferase
MNARIGQRPNLSVLRDDVRALEAYAVPSADGFIKLDAMENPFTLPEALQRQLGERLAQQPLNRYPLSDPRDFKERLGKAMGLPPGASLMLGNGSDELIHLVIQACARGSDHHVAVAELLDVRVVDDLRRVSLRRRSAACRFHARHPRIA